MKNLLFLIFILSLIVLGEAQVAYQMLMLSLQWTPTVCLVKSCDAGKVASFTKKITIHGLWPGNHYNPQPKCPQYYYNSFEPKTVSLKGQLAVNWPNMLAADDEFRFWAPEYEKHGTCMVNGGSFQQGDYFDTTLKLKWQVEAISDIRVALSSIQPNTLEPLNMFLSLLRSTYNVYPQLACPWTHKNTLAEVRFCFDKFTLQLINCQNTNSVCGTGSGGSIMIPG
ncbi:hypothetical protein OROGR_013915 [Orobanche gracilis]